ncbi:hypothetical protein ABPG75_005960 [Micractinium tetrahymenae]
MQPLPAQGVSSSRPATAWAPFSARPACLRTQQEVQKAGGRPPQALYPARRRRPASRRDSTPALRPAAAAAQSAPPAGLPKRVVITGGSRGLGFAMAQQFLAAGDTVAITGRDPERLAAAVEALQEECGDAGHVHGLPADCSSPADMERLGQWVQGCMGGVDLWLNNAGEVTAKRLLADVAAEEVVRVVGTNVVGSLLGCRQAVALMRQQPGADSAVPRYHVFNCGSSAWGAKFTKSVATHKSTKRALAQLNESLAQELREAGLAGIGVHNLSPGMLLTDLLLKDSTPAARRFFNALAEDPRRWRRRWSRASAQSPAPAAALIT